MHFPYLVLHLVISVVTCAVAHLSARYYWSKYLALTALVEVRAQLPFLIETTLQSNTMIVCSHISVEKGQKLGSCTKWALAARARAHLVQELFMMFVVHMRSWCWQTSQPSQCHHKTHGFSCDLTVSQWRPHFSRSMVHCPWAQQSYLFTQQNGLINFRNTNFLVSKRKNEGPRMPNHTASRR